jgi:hypothetical protein
MPDINGFAACWGISAIHCPSCHGYEVKGEKTGILANGDGGTFAFFQPHKADPEKQKRPPSTQHSFLYIAA